MIFQDPPCLAGWWHCRPSPLCALRPRAAPCTTRGRNRTPPIPKVVLHVTELQTSILVGDGRVGNR
jgi:hypothetical protein